MDERLGLGGSRRLLGRLRDVMAGPGSAQERLDQVVHIIAVDLMTEVCSAYLMRAGDILELCATEGLFPESVHRTRLRVGEGLIGNIAAAARPLALSDAQSHKDFAYRPETGEEVYHSLMGVPILRQGTVSGVLAVQNRERRNYTDEEIETLQTVAMVLAELVAGGELVSPDELHPVGGIATLPHRLEGVRLNAGLALGTAVLHEPTIVIRQVVAEDPERELERLERAVEAMHAAIDRMLQATDLAEGGEHRDILETYRMFAEDRGWLGRIREAIRGGLTAEASVQRVRDDTRARLKQVTDPYIRERMADLEDLANRLQHHLSGEIITAAAGPLPADVVLVARSMGPAELLDYDRQSLRALILEEGSPTSHVAIVARALDIPIVGRCKDALTNIQAGDQLVVDGDTAQVLIRPTEDVLQAIEASLQERSTRRARYQSIRELPAVTLDGEIVRLHMNAGLLIDLPALDACGADGIGLFRTELPFMVRSTFPTVTEQSEIYRRVLDEAGDRPVVFRTLDIGGDKLLPYLPNQAEENPAMGWRAIRLALDRPAMLRHQLRAMLGAANGRPLRIMFPLVTEVAEFRAARRILRLEIERRTSRCLGCPTDVAVGVMLEVPALLWQLEALCREVDFISVGSNDLMQFLFARDRGGEQLAERFDDLAPAALACLSHLVRTANTFGVPISVCGEMAGRSLEAMVLVGLGFRTLSMNASSIGPVKAMIRSLEVAPLQRYLGDLATSAAHSLRPQLRDYARDRMVVI